MYHRDSYTKYQVQGLSGLNQWYELFTAMSCKIIFIMRIYLYQHITSIGIHCYSLKKTGNKKLLRDVENSKNL